MINNASCRFKFHDPFWGWNVAGGDWWLLMKKEKKSDGMFTERTLSFIVSLKVCWKTFSGGIAGDAGCEIPCIQWPMRRTTPKQTSAIAVTKRGSLATRSLIILLSMANNIKNEWLFQLRQSKRGHDITLKFQFFSECAEVECVI